MEFEKSSIERLKRTLYSRNENVVPKEKRTPVQGQELDVPTSWGNTPDFGLEPEVMAKRNNSFFNKFLIGSLIFFVVALAISVFIFFGGINMISSNNLDIKITAPSSVSSGEELSIGLSVVNANRTDLSDVSLFVTYPDGSQSVDNSGKALARDEASLGTIASGSSVDYTVRALLSGEKDAIKTFDFRLEYKVKGSNAVFSKEKTYDVVIGSSPIILNVTSPTEVNSGATLNLSIDVTSNSAATLKGALIKIDYPYGFTYTDSNIKPLTGNSIWDIGDLKSGDKKTLLITGVLVGQDLEDRSFMISAGTPSADIATDIGTTLANNVTTVGIRKSFFGLNVTSDNNTPAVGQPVPVTINWENTLPDKVTNNTIVATVSGNAFDRSAVSVSNGGFYKSVDSTILWDQNSTDDLTTLSPGDSGQVFFSASSLPDNIQTRSIKNPHIDVNVVMTGNRSGADSGPVSSSANFTIKIPSTLSFTAKSFRTMGPFSNTGPVPPKADQESTYTITWTLTNTTNDLKDTTVSALLPVGVEWKSQSSPSGENISYDSTTRTVSWNVGNVASGTGFTTSPQTVSFQVGLTPSVNQVGSAPNLLAQVNVISTDTYTLTPLSVNTQSVTTQYSDPGFKAGNDVVVK